MSVPTPRRGEVWMANFSPGRGSEQRGIRPALVIQIDGKGGRCDQGQPGCGIGVAACRALDFLGYILAEGEVAYSRLRLL